MDNVMDYVEFIKAPWGKMFYDLLFLQLNIPQFPRLKILDFGSGLGVTSNHFAQWHEITAVEPNNEMIDNSRKVNQYIQIHGGFEKLAEFKDNTFDIVFCHNVLEYIEDKEPIFAELIRVLKPNGTLSLVKHNRAGRVFHSAVFENDPQKAFALVDDDRNDKSNYLGTQYIYSNDDVTQWACKHDGKIQKVLGMRAFWGLGQDNWVKHTDDWYNTMLMLENKVAEMDDYRHAAFFNHLLIEKTPISHRLR